MSRERDDIMRIEAYEKGVQMATSKAVVHGDVIEALTQALEYFENLEDVSDGDYGEPRPNREMSLAQMCRDALERVALKGELDPLSRPDEQAKPRGVNRLT